MDLDRPFATQESPALLHSGPLTSPVPKSSRFGRGGPRRTTRAGHSGATAGRGHAAVVTSPSGGVSGTTGNAYHETSLRCWTVASSSGRFGPGSTGRHGAVASCWQLGLNDCSSSCAGILEVAWLTLTN